MQPLNLVFAGTPDFAAKHLQAILQSSHTVTAVYTQPDRRSGRGKKILPSPVKTLALEHSIPVKQPVSLKDEEAQQQLAEFNPDLMIVVAYGLILPAAILRIPEYGCINVHASALPRWRGAAPIERAILAGDQETGVTIMQMDTGLDTGDILLQSPVTIESTDDRLSLESKLADAGTKALLKVLDHLAEFQAGATVQDDTQSTYAEKVSKQEAEIDWESALQVSRQLKAGIGRYPAYSFIEGVRVQFHTGKAVDIQHNSFPGTILEFNTGGLVIACREGTISMNKIQLPGKSPVTSNDLVNSNQSLLAPGARFSSQEANTE